MDIKQKVYNALGALVGNRCYPTVMPQQPAYPAIVFQVTSAQESALTQVARFTDYVVLVTLYSADHAGLVSLRAAVLAAAEAMPEHKSHDELGDGYDFEPKTYSWKVNLQLRSTET